jgi:hypothetical protein
VGAATTTPCLGEMWGLLLPEAPHRNGISTLQLSPRRIVSSGLLVTGGHGFICWLACAFDNQAHVFGNEKHHGGALKVIVSPRTRTGHHNLPGHLM